jgi:rhodanese-related sulfurtransferase
MSAVDALLAQARARIQRWSPSESHAHVERGALLIDIRPVAQRAAHGVVPGALCIERNVLEWRLDPGGDHRIPEATSYERRVIVLCQQGYASSLAADSLRRLGYSQAADMIDGFEGWRAAGLPTADFSP